MFLGCCFVFLLPQLHVECSASGRMPQVTRL